MALSSVEHAHSRLPPAEPLTSGFTLIIIKRSNRAALVDFQPNRSNSLKLDLKRIAQCNDMRLTLKTICGGDDNEIQG